MNFTKKNIICKIHDHSSRTSFITQWFLMDDNLILNQNGKIKKNWNLRDWNIL